MAVGDPAHQIDAKQDPGADLKRLDHRVLVDVDDVHWPPDEWKQPCCDAVGVEDDEAPGGLDQQCQLPLHAGDR